MKARFFTLFFLFFISASTVFATYYPYSVTVNNKSYDALPGGATTHVLAAANTALSPATVPIGFNFRFFGGMQDKVTINQNGQISFTNFVFPDFIDAICATLQPTATSQIAYGTINSTPSRIFIIEWKNMNIKNSGSGAANVTFHIELYETTGEVSMSYNQAPATNDENWYNGDKYGLVQEFKNIQSDFDLIYGGNLNTPNTTNVSGTSDIRHGYGNSFPAPGKEYAFYYVKPAGAPFIAITSPKTGQTIGHKPVTIWWNCTDAVKVIIKGDYGGNIKPIDTVLSGKTPYYWYPQFTVFDFNLIIEDLNTPTVKSTVNNLHFNSNGINSGDFMTGQIRLFPNPCKGVTTIDLSNFKGDLADGKVYVCNMLGQIVFSNNLSSPQIELSGLNKGLYIINLQVGEQRYTEKLVVE